LRAVAHVRDQWFRPSASGSGRERTARYGVGRRWLVSYQDTSGRRHAKSFDKKVDAERYLALMGADVARGAWVDPALGRTKFGGYAREWLATKTFDVSTREQVENRLRLYAYPTWEDVPLARIRAAAVQKWLAELTQRLSPGTVRQAFIHFSSILSAAVDDEMLAKNPCKSRSVVPPAVPRPRVVPWPMARVRAVIEAHPDRYRALPAVGAAAGLRQGEIFGLAVDDIDFLRRTIHVVRQVKYVRNQLVFAPPKYGTGRDVPLSDALAVVLSEHIRQFTPVTVELPWGDPGAAKVRKVKVPLLFTSRERKALNRNYINQFIWKPALADAGVAPMRSNGMHALRHFCASNWLEQGVSIRAVAEYLGHRDEGFTLRIYTHLMPTAEEKTRLASDALFVDERDKAVSQPK
jgi:integrase